MWPSPSRHLPRAWSPRWPGRSSRAAVRHRGTPGRHGSSRCLVTHTARCHTAPCHARGGALRPRVVVSDPGPGTRNGQRTAIALPGVGRVASLDAAADGHADDAGRGVTRGNRGRRAGAGRGRRGSTSTGTASRPHGARGRAEGREAPSRWPPSRRAAERRALLRDHASRVGRCCTAHQHSATARRRSLQEDAPH